MIDKFQRNEGGIYENPVLTEAIKESKNTQDYCQKVEDYMAEQLKNKFNKLEKVDDPEPYFGKIVEDDFVFYNSKGERIKNIGKKFSRPAYTYWDSKNFAGNLLSGKTLALNDIWAAEVILKELRFEGDNYIAKYEVTLWDHFGLNYSDLEKFFYYGNGFRAWFILQHIKSYKPFLTKITFTKEFKGNLNIGKQE